MWHTARTPIGSLMIRDGVCMRELEGKANIAMELPLDSATNFHCPPEARINAERRFEVSVAKATASSRFAKWWL